MNGALARVRHTPISARPTVTSDHCEANAHAQSEKETRAKAHLV